MPLDTNLLYGVMAGSWITHLAIPFATFMLVRALPYMEILPKTLVFLSICIVLSFGTQMGLLAVLQSSSCSGIKDYRSIAIGSAIAALITAAMVAIPAFIEPMRLVVSQLIIRHKTLLTPQLAKMEALISKTAEEVLNASLIEEAKPVQKGGAAISPEEYETQTFQEIAIGTSYWSAFAGAYGVGVGSLMAAKCPATS
jgi:hypothetical protein